MGRIDLDSPRYDQTTFEGRAKHFFITTNPLNVLATDAGQITILVVLLLFCYGMYAANRLTSDNYTCESNSNCISELDRAKEIVLAYKAEKEDKNLTEDQIWAAKQLYDSAFHCQTGEKLFLPGRMYLNIQ